MGGGIRSVDSSCQTVLCMLMMETRENVTRSEHIIDIPRVVDENGLVDDDRMNSSLDDVAQEGRSWSSERMQANNGLSSQNSSIGRRGEARRRRSPLNSGLWISVELVLTLSQIIASIVVLVVSGKEKPHSPLRAWIIGYASGSAATLPLLYWRYRHHNVSEQDSAQSQRGSARINVPAGPFSVSVSRASELDDRRAPGSPARVGQNAESVNPRVKVLVEYIKIALDCFFAVWFVVGNVWIFGGHSSISTAPNLYRLCIVFLTFTCIGYAMPLILCTTICCCFPCIISILRFREDSAQTRGATSESIDALPTYKFKSQRSRNGNDRDSNSNTDDGGILAAGTEKERMISREDAVCCICLAKYANNDDLRELPCSHFFHKECVDKWLKINASCPLCKCEVGETAVASPHASNPTQQQHVEIPVGTMF